MANQTDNLEMMLNELHDAVEKIKRYSAEITKDHKKFKPRIQVALDAMDNIIKGVEPK